MTDCAPLIDRCCCNIDFSYRGARWLSGRESDSGAGRRGLETYIRRVVSLGKILYSRHDWKVVDWDVKPKHKQTNEPCHEKTNVLVSDQVRHKPGRTAIEDGLRLETDLESRSYYICSENKGADQLRAVTAKLICVFVFAYAKRWFSHDAAQIICAVS